MFVRARRAEPQRRPIGAPGISIEQYERIAARIRQERAGSSLAPNLGAATRPSFQPSAITEGTRP